MLPTHFPSWKWLMERNDLGAGFHPQTNFIRSVEQIYIPLIFFSVGDLNLDAVIQHQERQSQNASCHWYPGPVSHFPSLALPFQCSCCGHFPLLTDSPYCQPPNKQMSCCILPCIPLRQNWKSCGPIMQTQSKNLGELMLLHNGWTDK